VPLLPRVLGRGAAAEEEVVFHAVCSGDWVALVGAYGVASGVVAPDLQARHQDSSDRRRDRLQRLVLLLHQRSLSGNDGAGEGHGADAALSR
jgi:hypothetical protein